MTRQTPLPIPRTLLFALAVVGIGVLAGILWHLVVTLPTFLTADDSSLQMTERAQGQVFAIDAVYSLIGVLFGALLGILAWKLWSEVGWQKVLIGAVGALAAALLCWAIGVIMGPGDFAARAVAAQPGDRVPVDFALRARSAVLTWCIGALAATTCYTLLSRELLGRWLPRRSRAAKPGKGSAQDSGQFRRGHLDR